MLHLAPPTGPTLLPCWGSLLGSYLTQRLELIMTPKHPLTPTIPGLAVLPPCASPEEPPVTQNTGALSCLQALILTSPSDHTPACPLADSASSFGAPPGHCHLQEVSSTSCSVPNPLS